jgi:hemoglobin
MSAKQSLYTLVGGETGLRNLVETFYDIIEFEPEGTDLKMLHLRGMGVGHSRIEQFNFLSDFLGGPKLYAEKHGHSNVRQMHVHIEIGKKVHDDWLNCMSIAIDRVGLDKEVGQRLMKHFRAVAAGLQNRP